MIKNLKQTAKNRRRINVRNKFVQKYSIDIDMYLNDDDIEQFSDNLSGALKFIFNFIFPMILAGIVSLIASIILGIVYNSSVFGIYLFIAAVPIFILGTGSMSLSYSIKKLVSCIFFIIEFTINKTNMIYIDFAKNHRKHIKVTEIAEIVTYVLIIPSGNKLLKENIFTFIPYFFISKIISFVAKRSCIETEKAFIVVKDADTSQTGFVKKLSSKLKKIRSIVNFLMYIFIIIILLLGILSSFIGILLLIKIFKDPSIIETSTAGGFIKLIPKAIVKLLSIVHKLFA